MFFLGLVALITPLTPGSWLVFVGLELLGIRVLLFDKLRTFSLRAFLRQNLRSSLGVLSHTPRSGARFFLELHQSEKVLKLKFSKKMRSLGFFKGENEVPATQQPKE